MACHFHPANNKFQYQKHKWAIGKQTCSQMSNGRYEYVRGRQYKHMEAKPQPSLMDNYPTCINTEQQRVVLNLFFCYASLVSAKDVFEAFYKKDFAKVRTAVLLLIFVLFMLHLHASHTHPMSPLFRPHSLSSTLAAY